MTIHAPAPAITFDNITLFNAALTQWIHLGIRPNQDFAVYPQSPLATCSYYVLFDDPEVYIMAKMAI